MAKKSKLIMPEQHEPLRIKSKKCKCGLKNEEPIYYDCTLAEFAEQMNVPLYKAMEFGKYFQNSRGVMPNKTEGLREKIIFIIQGKIFCVEGDMLGAHYAADDIITAILALLPAEKMLDQKQYAYFASRGKEIGDNYFDKFNQDRGFNQAIAQIKQRFEGKET